MRKFLLYLSALLPLSVFAYQLNRVSVHDPSVVWEPSSKTYYIFGSHRAVAKTTDMMDWSLVNLGKEGGISDLVGVPWRTGSSENAISSTAFLLPEVTKVKKGGAEVDMPSFNAMQWSARGGVGYNINGNLWAPDVIYNKKMKKWCMYMSVNGENWYSSIVMLTADNIEGPYTYQAPVVISGFQNGDSYKDTDLELVLGAQSTLPERYNVGGNWYRRWPNCIDPCVFYDEDGKLWMSYGSWFGGIFMLELDEETGLRDYDVTYELKGSNDGITVDPYFGKKVAGGYHSSGEASYIEHIGDYYFLFVTYGGLTATGGYQMRVFRSETPNGPYVDANNVNALYANYQLNFGADAITNRGVNIFGAYGDWGNVAQGNYAERAQGHNSIIAAEDGRTYLVYHTRFQNRGEWHEVRVHQVFQNEDGWLVAAPFEYTGEQVKSADIATSQQVATSEIPGTYKLLIHRYKLDNTKSELVMPEEVQLNSDGTISGAQTGSWEVKEGTSYITITINNRAYKGVMVAQKLEPTDAKADAFTALAKNGVTIWGYKEASPTGIHAIDASTAPKDNAIYDLQGQRVTAPLRKGIFIKDGKKIVIK